MRAVIYRRRGVASEVLSLEEVPVPMPGPGEVRVRIYASGVNPTDWKSRLGAGVSAEPLEEFQIPHHDGAGVIDAVGPGVASRAVGERVWVFLAAFQNRWGTAAEYALLPAGHTRPLPESVSFEFGACLGVPAVTAAHCLGNGPEELFGKTVLVSGGAGAVGHFAIELAHAAGARVAATVSSDAKAQLAREAGADLVVNYREPGSVEALRAFSPRMDRIVEVALGANLEQDLAVTGPGTIITVYASEPSGDPVIPTGRLMALNATLHYVLLYGISDRELCDSVNWVQAALEAGVLSPLPLHRYPLEEAARAQDAVETHAVGKVLVLP